MKCRLQTFKAGQVWKRQSPEVLTNKSWVQDSCQVVLPSHSAGRNGCPATTKRKVGHDTERGRDRDSGSTPAGIAKPHSAPPLLRPPADFPLLLLNPSTKCSDHYCVFMRSTDFRVIRVATSRIGWAGIVACMMQVS
jgi:hypothetical protein